MGISVSKSTTATVTFSTPQEIIISHTDDSIRIGDGTDLANVTAAGALQVDGSGVTQPISAASLPLPTGAATAANQSTANSQLTSINTKLPEVSASISGTFTGVLQTTSALETNGASSCIAFATGTFSQLIAIEGTYDGTIWRTIPMYDYYTRTAQLYISTNNDIATAPIGGFKQVRLRCISYTSGTAIATLHINAGTGRMGVFNQDAAALYATTNIRDGGGNSLTSATTNPTGTERGLITRNIPSGTQAISVDTLPLPTGAATEATLNSVLTELQQKTEPNQTQQTLVTNVLIPTIFDEINITSKNSNGDPLTIVYKSLSSTVATLTLSYDVDGDLESVVRS